MSGLWRRIVRRASGILLGRQSYTPEQMLGRQGEEAAYWHLREHGFIMVERNYSPQGLRGEIDLIGWDGDTLVFVEVKTRTSGVYLAPESAVNQEKQRKMTAVAGAYLRKARKSCRFRFDIVSVVPESADMRIEHFRDVFREQNAAAVKA